LSKGNIGFEILLIQFNHVASLFDPSGRASLKGSPSGKVKLNPSF
jgi:hypothetical protein